MGIACVKGLWGEEHAEDEALEEIQSRGNKEEWGMRNWGGGRDQMAL